VNNFYKLNQYSWWQALLGAAGNMPSPSRTILERRDRSEAHNWSVTDAEHERNFQREMFGRTEQLMNTSHQREVDDLRKAGLNPILSGTGGGGAGSPSGGSGSSTGPIEDIDYKDVDTSSALEVMERNAAMKLLKAQEHATNSAADASRAQARKTNKEADILGPKSTIYQKISEGISSGIKAVETGAKDMKQKYDNRPKHEEKP